MLDKATCINQDCTIVNFYMFTYAVLIFFFKSIDKTLKSHSQYMKFVRYVYSKCALTEKLNSPFIMDLVSLLFLVTDSKKFQFL